MTAFKISFEPMQEVIECQAGETILEAARRERVRISSSCGGHGTCMSCAVQITDGALPSAHEADAEVFSDRRLGEGWRRACITEPTGDCTISVPARSTAAPVRTQVDGLNGDMARLVDFEPVVKVIEFELDEPTLDDGRSDESRLRDALAEDYPGACESFDAALLRTFALDLRRWGWAGWLASIEGEVIAAGSREARVFGMAVDLGTTNMSGFLVDMMTGETLAAEGMENPQTSYGADLITYASHIRRNPETAKILQELAVEAINDLAADMCDAVGAEPSDIVEITIAGNTMMHHLLLGLPVTQLAMSPFISAYSDAFDLKARDLEINVAPGGYVHLLPNIAGFVGGDHVASLLASEIKDNKPVIIMDIGTNTELSLVQGDNITSVSCPSGPAFEGGNISFGMRAAAGAIESVRIKGNTVQLQTIGDETPVGICGSGVMDIAAQLHLGGVCNERGRLQKDHPRVKEIGKNLVFVLADEEDTGGQEITFSQDDLRAVQLAKAAIRAATDLLLKHTAYSERELRQIIIAGAFGSYIDVDSALAIGLLPDLPYNRFAQVGNAAGDGARFALLSEKQREAAKDIARRSNYIELASDKAFMKVFGSRINFEKQRAIKSVA